MLTPEHVEIIGVWNPPVSNPSEGRTGGSQGWGVGVGAPRG